jgi:alpha-aminoadipic semialdehyde synthase
MHRLPSHSFRNSPHLMVLADAACDVNGSVEFLRRTTTIEDPFFYVDASQPGVPEVALGATVAAAETNPSIKLVCGVDILPSELPRDASRHFGECLLPFLPFLARDPAAAGADEALPPALTNATICERGALTASYRYIGAIRTERERKQAAAKSREELRQGSAQVVRLHGHLFDSKLINRALDLVESLGGKFRIVQAGLAQPRGGPGREHRAHTQVLLQVEAAAAAGTEELVGRLESLVAEAGPDAEAHMERLGPDFVLDPPAAARKETATFSVPAEEEPRPSLPAPRLIAAAAPGRPRSPSSSGGGGLVVFGAGLVALPCVELLSRTHAVTVLASDAQELALLLARLPAGRGVRAVLARVPSPAVEAALAGAAGAVSLLPQPLHVHVALGCIAAGVPLVTASYVQAFGGRLAEVDALAKARGVPVLCEMGLDPGIDHMSARHMVRHVERLGGTVTRFESLCGGLPAPESARNPLGYKLSWSPRGMLLALGNPAQFTRDGATVAVPRFQALQHARELRLAQFSALALEEYPNRDALVYRERYGIPASVKDMYRGTVRYRGFADAMQGLLGLLDDTPDASLAGRPWREVLGPQMELQLPAATRAFLHWAGALPDGRVGAGCGSKLDALSALFQDTLGMGPEDRDLVLMAHRLAYVTPEAAGERTLTDTLVMFGAGGWDTAMARTVGLTAAIGLQVLLERASDKAAIGVLLPTEDWVCDEALRKLGEQGVRFEREVGGR